VSRCEWENSMKNSAQSFAELTNCFMEIVAQSRKFEGFKIPVEVLQKAAEAANLSEGDLAKAYRSLSEAERYLSGVLAGFVKHSPKHFYNLAQRLSSEVDEDLAGKVRSAIGVYANKVGKRPGWNESAKLYSSVAHCFVLAQQEQKNRNKIARLQERTKAMEKQVEYQRKIQVRQQEEQRRTARVLTEAAAALRQLIGV